MMLETFLNSFPMDPDDKKYFAETSKEFFA